MRETTPSAGTGTISKLNAAQREVETWKPVAVCVIMQNANVTWKSAVALVSYHNRASTLAVQETEVSTQRAWTA